MSQRQETNLKKWENIGVEKTATKGKYVSTKKKKN
jgi:hypothetical protein